MVGSDLVMIILGCIDLFLSGIYNEVNLLEYRFLVVMIFLWEKEFVVERYFVNDDDDVVFIFVNCGEIIVKIFILIIDDIESILFILNNNFCLYDRNIVINLRRNLLFEKDIFFIFIIFFFLFDMVEYFEVLVEV